MLFLQYLWYGRWRMIPERIAYSVRKVYKVIFVNCEQISGIEICISFLEDIANNSCRILCLIAFVAIEFKILFDLDYEETCSVCNRKCYFSITFLKNSNAKMVQSAPLKDVFTPSERESEECFIWCLALLGGNTSIEMNVTYFSEQCLFRTRFRLVLTKPNSTKDLRSNWAEFGNKGRF